MAMEVAMSIAQIVAQHLQALRRYARALTGSQSSGDAYVAATLELFSSIPDIVHERNPKLALFHSFARIWNYSPPARSHSEQQPLSGRPVSSN